MRKKVSKKVSIQGIPSVTGTLLPGIHSQLWGALKPRVLPSYYPADHYVTCRLKRRDKKKGMEVGMETGKVPWMTNVGNNKTSKSQYMWHGDTGVIFWDTLFHLWRYVKCQSSQEKIFYQFSQLNGNVASIQCMLVTALRSNNFKLQGRVVKVA